MSDSQPGEPGLRSDGTLPGEFFRLAWRFYLVLAIAGVIWLGLARGALTLELFLDPRHLLQDLALGVAAAFVLVGGWQTLRRFVAALRQLEDVMRGLFGPLDRSEVFVLALISGFAEELFFRGAMQSSLGWVWATVIFALLHTGPGRLFRPWTVFAAAAGLLFAALTHYRDNILAAFVAHFLVNWINLNALTSKSREPTDPSI